MAQQTGGNSRSRLHQIGSLFANRNVRSAATEESSLEVDVVDSVRDVEKTQWNEIVERSSRGSVFHRYEWLEAIETGLGYTPRHLVVTKDGNTIGGMPNFVVEIEKTPFDRLSSLYPGFGGPLLPTDTKDSLERVIEAIPRLCRGRTIVHQIRGLDMSYLRYNDALQTHGYRPYRRECRFLLDLTRSYDEIREGMSRSRRRGSNTGRTSTTRWSRRRSRGRIYGGFTGPTNASWTASTERCIRSRFSTNCRRWTIASSC